MKVTALVPMKACSERVPNKNIKMFGDKPLCLHIIETLLNVSEIDRIIVNTDSATIAKIVDIDNKICIQSRKSELCGNDVSMNIIINDIISHENGEHFLQTHCTNPLVKASTFSLAIRTYLEINSQYDSLFSVTELRQRLYHSDASPINHDMYLLENTQNLNPILVENSCIYLFSKKSFSEFSHRLGRTPFPFPIPILQSIDIDTEADFLIAESIYKSGVICQK